MNYILFDDNCRDHLLPLTFTRPVADLRVGIMTIREKWEYCLNAKTSSLTENYLGAKFPLVKAKENLLINGGICPTPELIEEVKALQPNQALVNGETIIAYYIMSEDIENFLLESNDNIEPKETGLKLTKINNLWDIFVLNDQEIKADFKRITDKRKSQKLDQSNQLIGDENLIFVEEGASVYCSTFNTNAGPIYIGKNAEIMEGSHVRGSVAICNDSVLKMGAKIYGGTTIGPFSKVGGELNNTVIIGYSNKAHDGFIGSSVIGEWCNIGADSNNSNLKNSYDLVKLWDYPEKRFVDTGLQFCGLIMGDHSKCGINTMFNTGSVIGVSCNIYGSGFHRNFISSFSWGGVAGFSTYELSKAIETAEKMYERRHMEFTDVERKILKSVFNLTFEYRKIS